MTIEGVIVTTGEFGKGVCINNVPRDHVSWGKNTDGGSDIITIAYNSPENFRMDFGLEYTFK